MKLALSLLLWLIVLGVKSQSIDVLKQRLEVSNDQDRPGIENNIAEAYFVNKKFKKATEYAKQAIEHAKSIKNGSEELRGLINAGNASKKQKKYNRAVGFFENSLPLATEAKNSTLVSYAYESMGYCFSSLKKYNQAIVSYQKALSSSTKKGTKKAAVYAQIAYCNFAVSEFKEAIEYYEKANDVYARYPSPGPQSLMLVNLGKVYAQYGDFNKAIDRLNTARTIAEKNGFDNTVKKVNSVVESIERNKANKSDQLTDFDHDAIDQTEKYIHNIERAHVKSLKEIENLSVENQIKELKLLNQQNELILKEQQAEAQKQDLARQKLKSAKTEAELKQVEAENAQNAAELKQAEAESARTLAWLVAVGLASTLMLALVIMYIRNNKNLKQKNDQIASQNKELDKKNTNITDSINYARKIQNALLASNRGLSHSFSDHFILNRPRDIVSGDFSWCDINEKDSVIALADCTGHGVPGALMSVLAISSLEKIVKQQGTRSPTEILKQLNDDLYSLFGSDDTVSGKELNKTTVKDGMDIVVINVNHKDNTLDFAGSRNSMLRISNGELTELKGSKTHLGHNRKHQEFNYQKIALSKGDLIYLYSDGFYDQKGGENGKKYYPKRFREMLLENETKSMTEQNETYKSILKTWRNGREQVDDILILGIRI
ncbi:MAG: SpoIIE family protein phosphatase [Flavobacteriales bacterium]|nr:SpoIIE family protein phosphatase [Flavobacteriales bacterium]